MKTRSEHHLRLQYHQVSLHCAWELGDVPTVQPLCIFNRQHSGKRMFQHVSTNVKQ